MKKIVVSNKVHYLGTNDRRKSLFENNWPLPNGVSYNSYLIADQKCALIDTLEFGSKDDYFEEIEHILEGRDVDYLVVNHMEPDHSSMIGWIIKRYPNVKIVANLKAFKMLDAFYGIPAESIIEVKDGDEINLGYHNLKFVLTPWVHW
ncbi:MAG: FprA family A-type flavoprotein, partial [Bacteroidales bacterium]|nr:FprA family A-type flavoprotein [Bacteroidales bacterium]